MGWLLAAEGSMTDYVLTGLVKRRAEIAGEIEHTHERLRQLILDLEHLDATILQFDSSYIVESIRPKAFRPPSDWANRGEMTRICLNILRQSAEPMTARDIAYQLLIERALNKEDQKLHKLMTKRVGVALRHQKDHGTVKAEQGPGMYLLWEVAR
jgi:hypothetical protein